MFDKIRDCINSSTTILHLESAFKMIENYTLNPDKDNNNVIILNYLLKEKCKDLGISYSDLNDYINKLN